MVTTKAPRGAIRRLVRYESLLELYKYTSLGLSLLHGITKERVTNSPDSWVIYVLNQKCENAKTKSRVPNCFRNVYIFSIILICLGLFIWYFVNINCHGCVNYKKIGISHCCLAYLWTTLVQNINNPKKSQVLSDFSLNQRFVNVFLLTWCSAYLKL